MFLGETAAIIISIIVVGSSIGDARAGVKIDFALAIGRLSHGDNMMVCVI